MQHVSKIAGKTYNQIDMALAYKDEEKNTICTLSLANPLEITQYFKWITIPSGNGTYQTYSVEAYAAYITHELINGNIIRDPFRGFADLRFMNKRLNRLLTMPSDKSQMPVSDITQDFKKRVTKAFFKLPQDEHPISHDDAKDLGLLVSLNIIDELKLLHTCFRTSQEAVDYLKEKTPKSYLLRTSTQGNASGSSDCTVFTISFVTANNTVFHIRLVDMHGVGVYVATNDPDRIIRCSDLNYSHLLKKSDMREFLAAIDYSSPQYACVVDCLTDLERLGYISIDKLIYTVYQIPS